MPRLKPHETTMDVYKASVKKINVLKAEHELPSQKETLEKILNGEITIK
jgi:hypothetical protein